LLQPIAAAIAHESSPVEAPSHPLFVFGGTAVPTAWFTAESFSATAGIAVAVAVTGVVGAGPSFAPAPDGAAAVPSAFDIGVGICTAIGGGTPFVTPGLEAGTLRAWKSVEAAGDCASPVGWGVAAADGWGEICGSGAGNTAAGDFDGRPTWGEGEDVSEEDATRSGAAAARAAKERASARRACR